MDFSNEGESFQVTYLQSGEPIEVISYPKLDDFSFSRESDIYTIKSQTRELFSQIADFLSTKQVRNVVVLGSPIVNLSVLQKLFINESKCEECLFKQGWALNINQQLAYLNEKVNPEIIRHAILTAGYESISPQDDLWGNSSLLGRIKANNLKNIEEVFSNSDYQQIVLNLVVEGDTVKLDDGEEGIHINELSNVIRQIGHVKESIFIISNQPESLKDLFASSNNFMRIYTAGYTVGDKSRVTDLIRHYWDQVENLNKGQTMDRLFERLIDWDIENLERSTSSGNFSDLISH